ncbi:MAG: aspartate 1-decarboxylase [Planctomycetaceae bacterium]|nr:aspartate 1-decarboxylase [Planctomycetaceae bacterium]
MQRILLKSKLHRATLTAADLNYEGSIAIDAELLEAADICSGEQVHVLNINNGSRLVTYAISALPGSRTVMLNGPAARCGLPGDLVVVISYANYDETELRRHKPTIVLLDECNRIKNSGGI